MLEGGATTTLGLEPDAVPATPEQWLTGLARFGPEAVIRAMVAMAHLGFPLWQSYQHELAMDEDFPLEDLDEESTFSWPDLVLGRIERGLVEGTITDPEFVEELPESLTIPGDPDRARACGARVSAGVVGEALLAARTPRDGLIHLLSAAAMTLQLIGIMTRPARDPGSRDTGDVLVTETDARRQAAVVVRHAISAELTPWSLGYYDPIALRVHGH